MPNSQTFFTNDTSAAGASSDYLKDAFNDISVPANNNTGFTSTVSTNPMVQYFGNDDAPKYSAKSLFVSDLILLEDKSLWINSKPTYQVVFNQSYPGSFAYCYGDIRLLNNQQGKCIQIRNIDDGFGITGIFRRVGFIVNPTDQSTGSADILLDGSDTGNDISFGGGPSDLINNGYPKFNQIRHGTSNETKNIHDYRIQANEPQTLYVVGVTVYSENATTNIDLFPGSTYVNKDKKTTTSLSATALPTITGRNGGRTVVYKDATGSYMKSTDETQSGESTGTGTSGTALVTVTTGHGASFPAGAGVVSISGTSNVIGSVLSVSTDTLTLTDNLPFNISGPLYKAWQAGPTHAINASLYIKSFDLDAQTMQVLGNVSGFGISSSGNFYWSDPNFKYRMWGSQLNTMSQNGYPGVMPNGASVGYLKLDGFFSAAEIEFSGAGILHATFSVNGKLSWGINEGFTGVAKKTVFTEAGPGWNSFQMSAGTSMGNVSISKVTLYEKNRPIGVSFGALAEFDSIVNQIDRGAINATLHALGTYRRIFADNLYFSGSWTRGATIAAAGGAYFAGSSTNSLLTFEYYGKNVGIIGTAGASISITVDGVAAGASLNILQTVASEGFHKVILTCQSGTTSIHAIDFTRTVGEVKNLQNFVPLSALQNLPKIYEQSNTPKNTPPGTQWMRDPDEQNLWVFMFERWYRLQTSGMIDDPNVGTVIGYGG